jgi:hypothetical protein
MPIPNHIFDPPAPSAWVSPTLVVAEPSMPKPSASSSRTPTGRPSICAASRRSSITRWCCATARYRPRSILASKSAPRRISKAARVFKAQGDRARVRRATLSRPYADGRRPLRHAGRTLLCHCCSATAPIRACSRNASITFNVLAPNVQGAIDFYAALGFRLTEYAEEDRPSGHIRGGLDAPQRQCARPRLHQWQGAAPAPSGLLGADAAADHSFVRSDGHHRLLANLERGPGQPAFPMPFSSTFVAPTGIVLRSKAATIRPWIPIMNRYAILAGRRCGVSRHRAPGLRRAAPGAVRGQRGRCRLGPRGGRMRASGVVRPSGAEQQHRIDR